MNAPAKRRIAGLVYLMSVIIMAFCIARMIPYGLTGEIDKVKPYFIFGAAAFIVGCPAGVAYYYYRSTENRDPTLERAKIETDALSYIGQKPGNKQKD